MSDRKDWDLAEHVARSALASHVDTQALAGGAFVRIERSLSNYAWRAGARGQYHFVRLARSGTEALGADLAAEAGILGIVSAAGIAPKVVRCDPAQRLLVTHWIEPDATVIDCTSWSIIEGVAQTMARLHRLRVPSGMRRICFETQARLLETAHGASDPPPAAVELQAAAAHVFSQLEAGRGELVLCHHDVHAQNLVRDADARLWFVDWEYAGRDDPVFDLASFASQCDLDERAQAALCEAYARAGGKVEQGRLQLAQWAFDYVQWLWYRGLQATGGGRHGHVEASRRSSRIEQSLLARASAVLRCNNRGFVQ